MSKITPGRKGPAKIEEASQFALVADSLALRYPPQALEGIEPGDLIFAYDTEGRQRYRSFNALEHCNYTLQELADHRWDELYSSDPSVDRSLKEFWARLTEGKEEIIHLESFPEYVIEETRTADRARFLVRERLAFRAVCELNGQVYVVGVKRVRLA